MYICNLRIIRWSRKCIFLILLGLIGIALSGCKERELGVYSLCKYEDFWKYSVYVDPSYD